MEKLESRDHLAMYDLCLEIADLMGTTKDEVVTLSTKVKAGINLIME